MTRLGAALDLRFTETVPEFVAFLADLGLDHVEIRQGYLDCHPNAPSPRELRAIARETGVSHTLHAPFRDANLGNLSESLRQATTDAVKQSLDTAVAVGAEAVVVHDGSVPRRYPDRVKATAREHAVCSLRECARYADDLGIHLCIENQRRHATRDRDTETPAQLATLLDDIDVDSEYLGVAVDVGHANVTGVDVESFVDEFGDRIVIAHLHDNDGTADRHDPLPAYESLVELIDADYSVFEMKSLVDIEWCVAGEQS